MSYMSRKFANSTPTVKCDLLNDTFSPVQLLLISTWTNKGKMCGVKKFFYNTSPEMLK